MDQNSETATTTELATAPEERPRLNMVTRAERTMRIFARVREGWAYDEIGREEGISGERVRQIVQEVLDKRLIDRREDHALLQITRLAPALRATVGAVERGDLKAVGPLLKVLDRLDRYQPIVAGPDSYGEDDRQRLLNKLNFIANNRDIDRPDAQPDGEGGDGARPHPAPAEEAPN